MKTYKIAVYDRNRNLLKSDVSSVVTSDIAFNSVINGGQGELELMINMTWDQAETWTDPFNFIQVSVISEFYPLGLVLYTGWISQRTPMLAESDSQIALVCLGLVSLLSFPLYKNGASFDVTHTNEDPADIIKSVVDYFQGTYPPTSGSEWIRYTGSTINDFGTDISYVFEKETCTQSVKKSTEFASGFTWFVDQNGLMYFKNKPSSADHVFTISKHVQELQPPEDIEGIINSVTVEYTTGTVNVQDSASISAYGLRDQYLKDLDITDSTTATAKAAKVVTENKNPKIQAKVVLNSNYNFESIRVGQTCRFLDYTIGSTVLTNNMQIVGVSYSPEFCEIELDGLQYSLEAELTKQINGAL